MTIGRIIWYCRPCLEWERCIIPTLGWSLGWWLRTSMESKVGWSGIHQLSAKQIRVSIPCGGSPRGVMVKAVECGIVVSEFELQSRYYVHFQTNTLGKSLKKKKKKKKKNPPSYGLNNTTTVLLEGWIWHWITKEGWYAVKKQRTTLCFYLFCLIEKRNLEVKIFENKIFDWNKLHKHISEKIDQPMDVTASTEYFLLHFGDEKQKKTTFISIWTVHLRKAMEFWDWKAVLLI